MGWFKMPTWFAKRPPKDNTPSIQAAPDRPQSTGGEWFASGFLRFSDPIYNLDPSAYETMRRTDVVAQPMNKLARKVGMMRLVAVGRGARCKAVQNICNHIRGLTDMLEFLAWAKAEGTRFGWVKGSWCGDFYAPDLRGGGRLKKNAGGVYLWNGYDYSASGEGDVVKVEEFLYGFGNGLSEAEWRKAKTLDRSRVIVYCSGATNNPEGDLDISWQLYLVAEAAALLDKAQRIYAERHSLPKEVYRKMIDQLRPDEAESVMNNVANRYGVANARQVMAMPAKDMFELLEPKGTTFDFLLEYRRQLEERASKIITDEFITSMGSKSPSQSSNSGEALFELSALSMARKISESLNDTLLPLIEQWNSHYLPPLEDGEPPIYLELRPISPRMKTTVAEVVQLLDREVPLPTDWLYEMLGCERDPSLPDFFTGKPKASPLGGAAGGGFPQIQPDGTAQRRDRPMQDGSEMPPAFTKKRKEDLRNLPDGGSSKDRDGDGLINEGK